MNFSLKIAAGGRVELRLNSGGGKPLVARSGRAAKYNGRVVLFPVCEGGVSVNVEVALAPEHIAVLEQDGEFWTAEHGNPLNFVALLVMDNRADHW